MDAIQEVIQQVLVIVLTGLVTALAAYLFRWVLYAVQLAKARLGNENFHQIWQVVYRVVQAAEQLGLSGQLDTAIQDKKQWALARIQEILNQKGLGYISVAELETLVESVVLTEFGKSGIDKELPKPPSDS